MFERMEFLTLVCLGIAVLFIVGLFGYKLGQHTSGQEMLPPLQCASTQGGYVLCVQEPKE